MLADVIVYGGALVARKRGVGVEPVLEVVHRTE
jgi:hypothetical protein